MTKRQHLAALLLCSAVTNSALAQGPSFACDTVADASIEAMICHEQGLSALDRQLAAVYAAATAKATNQHPPVLQAEQRGWIKGRNDCWKSTEQQQCVTDAYQQRIAELQASYRLVASTGSATFVCNGNDQDRVVASFFATEPATLIAERGDSVSLMYLTASGSGAKYQGRNESLWQHQGEALITWGYGAPEMHCQQQP
jgi:uncharacterized protein